VENSFVPVESLWNTWGKILSMIRVVNLRKKGAFRVIGARWGIFVLACRIKARAWRIEIL
jgi:hypothetical protein